MKEFIAPAYTFNPTAKTVDLYGISSFNSKFLVSIINQTVGQIIYSTASSSLGYSSVVGTVVTLRYDTSSMSAGDSLQIIYQVQGDLPVTIENFPSVQDVSVSSSVLPTGASTALLQSDGNTTLTSIDGKLTTTANGLKVDNSGVTQPISASSLPLPANAATESTLSALNTKVTTVDTSNVTITSPLPSGTNNIGSVNINSGTVTAEFLSEGATGAPVPVDAIYLGGNNAGNLVGVKVSSTGVISVDGSASTQPISASSLPLPSGAATEAKQDTGNSSLASIDSKLTSPLAIQGGNSTAVKVDGSAVTQPISGSVTATISGTPNVAVTSLPTLPSGTNTIGKVDVNNFPSSQDVNLHDGSGTSITSTTGSLNVNVSGGSVTTVNDSVGTPGAAVPSKATFIGGSDGTNLTPLSVSSAGILSVNASSTTTLPLPTGAATEITLSAVNSDTTNISRAVTSLGTTLPSNGVVVAGYNADGNMYPVHVDTNGNIILDQSSSTIKNYTHDANGVAILSSPDIIGGVKSGLDVNLLSGGVIGNTFNNLAFPNQDAAVSVGFLNGGLLVPPSMDTVTNQLIVDATQSGNIPVTVSGFSGVVSTSIDYVGGGPISTSNPVPVGLSSSTGSVIDYGNGTSTSNTIRTASNTLINGAASAAGAGNSSSSTQRVVIATDQSTLPVSGSFSLTGQDVLGTLIVGQKNNQIEIDFNTAPSSAVLTTSITGTGSSSQSNGHTIFTTGTATTATSKAVTVQSVAYRPGNELYAMFSAGFSTVTNALNYSRIGLYDSVNGFFIGFNGTSFGLTKRTNSVDTFTNRTAFNGDLLTGAVGSKFTRNGTPEAINLANANLFRIRFAWLGSAVIVFEVYSPDGSWVVFNTIRQPNLTTIPSLTNPNLQMTLEVGKAGSDASIVTIATACWAGGTTSNLSKITDVLTDNTLAQLSRSVITGVTTGGGGGYVNVKVNPSGALTVDSTVSSSALPTGASTSALQTTGNAILTSIDSTNVSINNKTPALGQALAAASVPVVLTAAQMTTLTPLSTVAATQSGTWNINNVSGTVSLPTGAATETTLSALNTKVVTTANGIKTDGSAVTQPVSATSLPLPTGAASETTQLAINTKTPSLGQALAAASVPVVLASDMSILATSASDLYITGQAAQTAIVNNIIPATSGATATDAANYKSGVIQINSTGTAGSYILETSNDNTNFVPLLSYNIALNTGIAVNGAVTATAANIAYSFSVQARYIRVRIVGAITGGSIQAFTRLSQAAWTPAVTSVGQATGAYLNTNITSGTLTTLTTLTGITNTVTTKQTSVKGQFIRNDYTVTPVTTSAYVQLIASSGWAFSGIEIFDSSGQTLVFAIGAAGSEADQFIIFPGGNGRIPFTLAVSQRISIKALSGTANVGEIDINFYQ